MVYRLNQSDKIFENHIFAKRYSIFINGSNGYKIKCRFLS
jgi:hypothetical protein